MYMFRPCFVTLHPKFTFKISFIQCIIPLEKDFQKIVITFIHVAQNVTQKIREAKKKSQHTLD